MFTRTTIGAAALLVLSGVSLSAAAQQAGAPQADNQKLERVEITGSSIKRIASQGALPVQTLSRADIERTGAKSTEELIQGLPSMQGFFAASESVNGSAGGVQNASLHNIGARYTLVLLNGRRLAINPFGQAGAGIVDTNIIPAAAIGRLDVGDGDEVRGQALLAGLADGEVLLVRAHRGADHLGRQVQERRVHFAQHRRRPFGQARDFGRLETVIAQLPDFEDRDRITLTAAMESERMRLHRDAMAFGGDLFQHQGFGGAEGFAQHSFHRTIPFGIVADKCRRVRPGVNEHTPA